MVALLLDCDVNIEARDYAGQTALHHAVLRVNMSIVRLLVDRGADVEAVANDGARPLWMAASLGKDHVASYLLNCDANIESFNSIRGTTALFESVKHGDVTVAQVLLENGADVDARIAAAQALTPPPVAFGQSEADKGQQNYPPLHLDAVETKPKKKFTSGSVIAWLGALGNQSSGANMDKLRRTRQWAQHNEPRDPSPSVSSGKTVEASDSGPGTSPVPPPQKARPPPAVVIEPTQPAAAPKQGKDEVSFEGKTRELKGHDSKQDEVTSSLKESIPQAPLGSIQFKDCAGGASTIPFETAKSWNVSDFTSQNNTRENMTYGDRGERAYKSISIKPSRVNPSSHISNRAFIN